METYEVTITETRQWKLSIKAPAEWAATERAQTMYDNGEPRNPPNSDAEVRARWVRAA